MESGSFESKKRKICHEHDDEDDEEKMEKFYAIINTIREARDRFIINNNKKPKVEEEGKHVAVWKPSFQPQDFMQNKPTATSQTKQAETGNDLRPGLDLDLTLSL
ncbi:hypothetical protein HRI_001268800 [Hibiscus trionum]|uniref:NIM1-interacting protein n=1 Tax=Hibiscus trionum TaxID=183268 RepID=A0A9W7LUT3_HIBTR|nr:hypothetical protein HRI_001268800 [Hibiscus trionum]